MTIRLDAQLWGSPSSASGSGLWSLRNASATSSARNPSVHYALYSIT